MSSMYGNEFHASLATFGKAAEESTPEKGKGFGLGNTSTAKIFAHGSTARKTGQTKLLCNIASSSNKIHNTIGGSVKSLNVHSDVSRETKQKQPIRAPFTEKRMTLAENAEISRDFDGKGPNEGIKKTPISQRLQTNVLRQKENEVLEAARSTSLPERTCQSLISRRSPRRGKKAEVINLADDDESAREGLVNAPTCSEQEQVEMSINKLYFGYYDFLSSSELGAVRIDAFVTRSVIIRIPGKGIEDPVREYLPFVKIKEIRAGTTKAFTNRQAFFAIVVDPTTKLSSAVTVGKDFDPEHGHSLRASNKNPLRYILLRMDTNPGKTLLSGMKNVPALAKVVKELGELPKSDYMTGYECGREDWTRETAEEQLRKEAVAREQREQRRKSSRRAAFDMESDDPEDQKICLIYPLRRHAVDAITIYRGDLKRLEPTKYLNDNLIDLKIKLLVAEEHSNKQDSLHVFSCLFYGKLTEIRDAKSAHSLVCRWTKNVNLFAKEVIVVPINYSLHWSLCVVLHPKEIMRLIVEEERRSEAAMDLTEGLPGEPEAKDDAANYPCIICMDSLGMHSKDKVGKTIRNYLRYEWYAKHMSAALSQGSAGTKSGPSKAVDEVFGAIPIVKVQVKSADAVAVIDERNQVPMQKNGYDCGVFVIKYVEQVLEQWPTSTKKDIEAKFTTHFGREMFTQEDVTEERVLFKSKVERLLSMWESAKDSEASEAAGGDPSSAEDALVVDGASESSLVEFTQFSPVEEKEVTNDLLELEDEEDSGPLDAQLFLSTEAAGAPAGFPSGDAMNVEEEDVGVVVEDPLERASAVDSESNDAHACEAIGPAKEDERIEDSSSSDDAVLKGNGRYNMPVNCKKNASNVSGSAQLSPILAQAATKGQYNGRKRDTLSQSLPSNKKIKEDIGVLEPSHSTPICDRFLKTYAAAVVINKDVSRTIDATSGIVRITTEIKTSNVEKEYTLIFPNEQAKNLAFLSVTSKGKALKTAAPIANENFSSFVVDLSENDSASPTLKILSVFTGVLEPYPAEIKQDEYQYVRLVDSHYFFSPYQTENQKTVVKLASSSIESYSKLSPHSAKGATVQFGAYKDVAPFAQSPAYIHYMNNHPFAKFSTMTRELEISHWGNIAIEEIYELKHAGAKLIGGFSRFDYQMKRGGITPSFRSLVAVLPPQSNNIYYRDQIGNISTSDMRTDSDGNTELHIQTRFPIFGGWQTQFYLGYSIPTESALSVGDDGRFNLKFDFFTSFEGVWVEDMEYKVILPEGASDIKVDVPYPVEQSTATRFTYLDSELNGGRPVLIIKAKNLVEEHDKEIHISYSFERNRMLFEPMLLVATFFAFFVVCSVVSHTQAVVHELVKKSRSSNDMKKEQ